MNEKAYRILEGSRRAVGLTFPIMAIFFLIYAAFGEMFPGIWAHKNFTFNQIFQNLYHTTNGIWGQMVGLSAGMLAMFGIFGAILSVTGGSQTFIRLAQKLTGKTVGGPGKVSLVASGLFGMVSGSAMANVVATGTFTIPMMKDAGYNKEWSAAISAVGSTGGQIMPALLYYMGAFVALHYLSKRLKIFGEGFSEKIQLMEFAIIFVPLAVFVGFLAFGYTVTKAAFYATVVAVVVTAFSYFLADKNAGVVAKKTGGLCMKVATSGAESILSMAGLLAGAQISIALISQTGFGVKLSTLIVSVGGNHLFLCLLLSMVVCFILGMGLPPTAAYVLAAAILAPALISLGLDPMVAHLFVFYFSTIGAITPPVCAAVFLSSSIADSNWLKTGGLSILLAIPAFVVPFTFAYNDALMLNGAIFNIVMGVVTSAIGVFFIGMAVAGFTNREMNLVSRILMFAGGVAMIVPETLVSVIGLVICAAAFVMAGGLKKKEAAA